MDYSYVSKINIKNKIIEASKQFASITMATTNDILVVGLVRDHNKNNVKFDDYKILNNFEICDI